jgi:FixJ family two-component response regulator
MEPFEGKRVLVWATSRALEADSAHQFSAVKEALSRLGCRVEMLTSDQPAVAGERLEAGRPDLILAHVCNKCRAPLEMLERAHLPPVVLLATALEMPIYLEGMRRGAFDCVGLPVQEKEFIRVLARALQEPVREQTTLGNGDSI